MGTDSCDRTIRYRGEIWSNKGLSKLAVSPETIESLKEFIGSWAIWPQDFDEWKEGDEDMIS
jgi:hypothetical protein